MSSPSAAAVEQQAQFTAWGMPVIYVATAAVVFGAFVPHFRANFPYIKQHIAGYVGKLSIFAILNIICSIFLFWSPAIHLALINFLLNFMVLCTISIPSFPKDFARTFALVFTLWLIIYTGVAPVRDSSQGVLNRISDTQCSRYYRNDPDTVAKICKDGWVTFTVFCAIITIGFTFLASMILTSVAFDPALQGAAEPTSQVEGGNNTNPANAGSYQQAAVAGNDGEYNSYQSNQA